MTQRPFSISASSPSAFFSLCELTDGPGETDTVTTLYRRQRHGRRTRTKENETKKRNLSFALRLLQPLCRMCGTQHREKLIENERKVN